MDGRRDGDAEWVNWESYSKSNQVKNQERREDMLDRERPGGGGRGWRRGGGRGDEVEGVERMSVIPRV